MSAEAKEHKSSFEKVLRAILLVISFLGLPIGIHLLATSSDPEFVASGMSEYLVLNGQIITGLFLTAIAICAVFYAVDCVQLRRTQKKPVHKIIASIFGWLILAVILGTGSFILIAPNAKSAIIAYTEKRDDELFAEATKDIEYNPLEDLEQNYQTMSEAEIQEKLEEATLSRIDFGTDASGNKTSSAFQNLLSTNVYAKTSDIVVLNRAKLSSDGHFVVFYTDTGDDKISYSRAVELGEMAETIIKNYKTNLGLDYSYQKIDSRSKNLEKVKTVLKANNIDENILDTAMPIYVADPFSEKNTTIAFYADKRFNNALQKVLTTIYSKINSSGDEDAKLIVSTPTLPFFVIRPDYVETSSLFVVSAHELGHHFASLICDEKGSECARNNFISETLPNYFSANVSPDDKQPAGNNINTHHEFYIKRGTCYSINITVATGDTCQQEGRSFGGYPAYAFLQNYVNIVPDGQNKIINALMSEDALAYLYEQTTPEKFAEVMTTLSQKNLTNDYSQKSLIAHDRPTGEELPCEYCTKTYTVNPAAMRYFYLPKESYGGYTIKISGNDKLSTSIMGQDESGKYNLINSFAGDGEYTYDKDSNYRVVAVVTANASISEKSEVTLGLEETKISKELSLDLNLKSGDPNCVTASITDIINTVSKVLGMVESATGEKDLVSEFKKDSADVRVSDGNRKVTFCERSLKNVTSLADAEKFIKSVYPTAVSLMKSETTGTYLSYNLFKNNINIAAAMVFKDDGDALVYLINIK